MSRTSRARLSPPRSPLSTRPLTDDELLLCRSHAFWSLTAYTPESIELIPNPIRKYRIASYSGLQYNSDGSLTIRLAREKPAGVPAR
mgnify:CR=1 FL=1